jgi:hypothetical protein
MKKNLLFLILMLLISIVSIHAQNIILVTDEDVTSQPFADLLATASYTVEIRTDFGVELSQDQIDELNAADLVLFARNTNSANYNFPDSWNIIESPILMLSSFMTRSTRLKWLNSTEVNEADGIDITVVDETHAIFEGIDLSGGSILVNETVALHTNNINDAGNGTILATSVTTGNIVIAEWPLGTEFYEGAGQFAADYRAVFFMGLSYDFTESGSALFLNLVNYILNPEVIEEPSSISSTSANNICIYPSPAINSLTFEGNIAQNASIEVVSLSGQVVLSSALINNKVDVSNLNSGVYILKISSNQHVYTSKIVKK